MTTKTTAPVDPLAGIPTGTASPKRVTTPAGAAPINLAAERKRRKLSGQAYKDARDFARSATGYNDTSPIWGKRLHVVLTDIEAELQAAYDAAVAAVLITTPRGDLDEVLARALLFNRELQKRIATGQLIGAQS